MDKIYMTGMNENISIFARNERSILCRNGINENNCFKVFSKSNLSQHKSQGIDLEKKILDAEKLMVPKGVVAPSSALYLSDDDFVGYGMEYINGKGLDCYMAEKRGLNVSEAAEVYSKLEAIVRETDDFVFPDLATLSNILISSQGEVKLLDYDGMQTGDHKSMNLSLLLCSHPEKLLQAICSNKKYCNDGIYNKNLDKRSLAFIYILMILGVGLGDIAKMNGYLDGRVAFESMCLLRGIQDTPIKDKLENMLFSANDDEYLGEDVFSIADSYEVGIEMAVMPNGRQIGYKKLIKK